MPHVEYIKTLFGRRLTEIDQCKDLFRFIFDFMVSGDCLFECLKVYYSFQLHLLVQLPAA